MATTPPDPSTDILPGLSSPINPPGSLAARLRRVLLRRYRPVLTASIVTLTVSATLLRVIAVSRWQGRQAVKNDTSTLVTQTNQQLLSTLRSRRGTLTLLRDTLNRRPNLTPPQLEAMAESATDHTRHLLGIGIVEFSKLPKWWWQRLALGQGERWPRTVPASATPRLPAEVPARQVAVTFIGHSTFLLQLAGLNIRTEVTLGALPEP